MDDSLRFDWFDTLRIDLLDDLASKVASEIDLGLSTRNQSLRQLQGQRSNDLVVVLHLLSCLYQSFFNAPTGTHRVSIPTSPSGYTRGPDGLLPLKFPYRSVMRVLKALHSLKWICLEKGNTIKGITRISACGYLIDAFKQEGLQWFPQEPKSHDSLVLLRDREHSGSKKKVDLSVPDCETSRSSKNFLYRYNSLLVQHCIALGVSDDQLKQIAQKTNRTSVNFFQLQLRRIFSRGSMTKGGRFYGGWWQSLPSIYRPHITIDGYRTTEVDYSSVDIRILYATQGVVVPQEKDLYDIGLPKWEGPKDPRRKVIKIFLNALLNDESGRYRLKPGDLKALGCSHAQLMTLMHQQHKPIKHLFNKGAGLDAQFIDSEIAMKVMQKMMDENILVLPIHDSFIVRLGHRATLRDAMHEAFQEVAKQQTSIDETGAGSKESFGIKLETMDTEDRHRVITLEQAFDREVEMPSHLMNSFVKSWRRYNLTKNR